LSSASCARRDIIKFTKYVGQKRADRSIEKDVERQRKREGWGSKIKKKTYDWLPLQFERSRATAN